MFTLLISLIAIALVAVLALASVYYGGASFNNASVKAKAAQLAVEAEQIRAAVQLFQHDKGRLPTSLDELTANNEYLKGSPSEMWGNNAAFIQTDSTKVPGDVCLAFNTARDIPYVPTCEDPQYRNMVMCCQVTE